MANTISMATKKNRTNDRKSFCILYLSLMASASIAVAVQAMDERRDSLTVAVHDMLLGALYATSSCVMFSATIYFAVKRDETFEAALRISGPVSFIVKYSRCGESVNLYLRLGLALFAAMSIGQSAIRFHEMQSQSQWPTHWPEAFKLIFEINFYTAQTLFILINHRIVILHNNEIFGACFIHVLSTNLCMWADVMVDKVSTTLHLGQRHGRYFDTSNTSSISSGSSLSSGSFYLLPAVSEYCLLSAALIYDITIRIGQPSYIELEDEEGEDNEGDHALYKQSEENENDKSKRQKQAQKEEKEKRTVNACPGEREQVRGSEAEKGTDQNTINGHNSRSCYMPDPEFGTQKIGKRRLLVRSSLTRLIAKIARKANAHLAVCSTNIKSGYWAPLLIVLTTTALTVVTGVAPKTERITPWKCAVLFAEEMILNCMAILVTLIAFIKIRHLKFTIASHQSAIDEFVLYIAFFFSANYLVATVALASYFNRVIEDMVHKGLLMGRLMLNILELVEVILQTYLIQDCFRRCSEEDLQQRIKPGRQMIAVLLGINLASWVVNSFQLKEADILYNITVNGEIAYGWVLIAITMPVFLFYRYHCTVCLSQAFTMIYEDETRRFEALWRQNPIYLSNLLSHTNLAMCEERDHFHACENRTSVRMSNRQLNEMLYRKFSTQSFQQMEYMLPRRASFFHLGGPSTSTTNVHDAELFHAPHHVTPSSTTPPVHKLAIPHRNQKKLSVPSPKSGAGAQPSHGLAASESYEGPNYFLSQISFNGSTVSALRNEHSTQTTSALLPFEQHHQPTSTYHHQRQLPRPSTHRSPGGIPSHSNRCMCDEGVQTPDADGMQRRQTLVNLETARYRYLAAEMAHRRVFERAIDGAGESEKRQAKGKRKRGKNEKPPTAKGKPIASSSENNPSDLSSLASPEILEPPEPPTVQPSHTHPSIRGFEPSKMVPLLIARSLVNATDAGPLTIVPEEGANDLNDTLSKPPSPPSSSSPSPSPSPPPPPPDPVRRTR